MQSKIDFQQKKIREQAIDSLILFYQNEWPCDEKSLKNKFHEIQHAIQDDKSFQLVMMQFKNYINGGLGSHPSRYASKNYLLEICWVYETQEFKKLKELTDQFINKPNNLGKMSYHLLNSCFNFIHFVINKPIHALTTLLAFQAILQPTAAFTYNQNDWDEYSLDTCPAGRASGEYPPFLQDQCSRAWVRNNSFFKNIISGDDAKKVILFGEHHKSPEVTNMINRIFPALLKEQWIYASEFPSEWGVDELIKAKEGHNFFDRWLIKLMGDEAMRESLRLYKNIKRYAINHYSIDDDEITYNIQKVAAKYSQRYGAFDVYHYIVQMLDGRDQTMAKNILKILKDLKQNVFVLCGKSHIGIAWYLLDAGCDVTFVGAPTRPDKVSTNPLYNDDVALTSWIRSELAREISAARIKYPNFNYIEIPKRRDYTIKTQHVITKELMDIILTEAQGNEAAHLSLFWESYRSTPSSFFNRKTFDIEDNIPPSWGKIATDAIHHHGAFFSSQSKRTLKNLGYIDKDGNCNPKEVEQLCNA